MTATAPSPTTAAPPRPAQTADSWTRLLAWTAGVVAGVDVAFFGLIREVIPPLAVGAILTVVGLVLLRRSRRWGIGVLGVTSLLLVLATMPFAVDHLAHPESGVDWFHAVVGVFGRLLAMAAAVAAWRGAAGAAGRRTGAVAFGLLGVVVVIAAVGTLATSGAEPQADDVVAPVDQAAFPDEIVITTGGALFVDNRDIFRHTFTVEGTDLDVELPALQGVRVPVDLAPGTYDVVCAVPGHEFMSSSLAVQ